MILKTNKQANKQKKNEKKSFQIEDVHHVGHYFHGHNCHMTGYLIGFFFLLYI